MVRYLTTCFCKNKKGSACSPTPNIKSLNASSTTLRPSGLPLAPTP